MQPRQLVALPSSTDIFWEVVSDDFCRMLTRIIFKDYRKANEHSEEHFAPQEAHDIRPYLRRSFIEQDVRKAAREFPPMIASAVLNSVNNCYHTEIRVGRVVLTISAVETPETIVRDARFRLAYANEPQMAMPIIERDDIPTWERSVYALAIHGPNPRQRGLPGFMHIVFPVPDCSEYAARIDLFKRYPDIPAEFGVSETIGIPDAYLRRDAMPSEDDQEV